jgi:hypothetical protein
MRRVAAISVLVLAAGAAFAQTADAQCIITPAGPVGLDISPRASALSILSTTPVARGWEGPLRTLPPRDFEKESSMKSDRALLANRTTAVVCLSEMLLDGAYGPLDPRQEEAMQKLVQAAQDIKDLIRANHQTSFFE